MPEIKRERDDEDEDEDEDVNEDDDKEDDEDNDEVRKEPALVRSLYVEHEHTQRSSNHAPLTPCYAVAWSPDCTKLATGGCIASLRGHDDSVSCVEFSPDGATLATGSYDLTIKLWTVSTGICRATLCGHECEGINACAWSPDGSMLASAGGDETARLWDTVTGACKAILWHTLETLRSLEFVGPQVWNVCWSSDGDYIASCSEDQTLRLWDVAGVCKATLTSDDGIWGCAWGKGNRVIAGTSCSGDFEPRVDLWNVSTGRVESTFTVPGTDHVGHVSFSPCGRWIATAGAAGEGAMAIWSASTGANAATMHVDHYVSKCPFSPDGTMLAAVTGKGSLYLWMLVWTPANHGMFPAEVRECVLVAVKSLRRKGLHLEISEIILRFAFSTLL